MSAYNTSKTLDTIAVLKNDTFKTLQQFTAVPKENNVKTLETNCNI